MFRQRPLVILSLALMCALVAGFAAVRYSAQQPAQAQVRSDVATQVVVAARDLPVGHFITEADVQTIGWPSRAVPEGYINEPSVAVGRGLIAPVRMNSPILGLDLAERGSGAGMPIIFPEGMRAVSVRVDDVISVAGYAVPGTRVDVMLTMKMPNGSQMFTQTILQNLHILGAGQTVQKNEEGQPITYSVATLMVTPEQAEKLVLAASQGRIQLALRNMLDVEDSNTTGIPDNRLFELGRQPARTASGGGATPRPRPRAPDENVIEVFRGGVRSLQRF